MRGEAPDTDDSVKTTTRGSQHLGFSPVASDSVGSVVDLPGSVCHEEDNFQDLPVDLLQGKDRPCPGETLPAPSEASDAGGCVMEQGLAVPSLPDGFVNQAAQAILPVPGHVKDLAALQPPDPAADPAHLGDQAALQEPVDTKDQAVNTLDHVKAKIQAEPPLNLDYPSSPSPLRRPCLS